MGILDKVGNTELINLQGINIKLEYLNPTGSIKDRIAKYIIQKAESKGLLRKGYKIIVASSGNTGIAFSAVGALKGYEITVVMPRGMSKARYKIIKSYGGKIVNVKDFCFSCAIDKAIELSKSKKTYLPRQFDNPWNPEDHEKNLGYEIIKQLNGKKIDALVAGVGTGGTLIGVGKALRKKFPKVKIFALEPDECHILADYGIGSVSQINKKTLACKTHKIEGIGDGIVPEIIKRDQEMISGVIEIKSKEAIKMSVKLKKQGYFVGTSSGANFLGALKLKKQGFKNIVTFFCDSGDRYLD